MSDETELDYVAVKCVVVGDGAVGKTSMLMCFATNTFPTDHMPTIFDNYSKNVTAEDGRTVNVGLWDTAGQDEYAQFRPLSYDGANVMLLAFSCDSRESYESVEAKWKAELETRAAGVPIVLVATKTDLRDAGKGEVSRRDGEDLKLRIDAAAYVECSALTQNGLAAVFDTVVDVHLNPKRYGVKNANRCCVIQ
jgi:Ras-related C3 botulinum toxin substrate 1